MDSLRADHIYGRGHVRRRWTRLGGRGCASERAYPEGMPTIPARRAIMAGQRTFPSAAGVRYRKDLPPQPGWEPVGSDGEMWTAGPARAGWTTGYVTDNPHILLRRAQALPGEVRSRRSWWPDRCRCEGSRPRGLRAAGARPQPSAGPQAGPRPSRGWPTTWRQPARPRREGLPRRPGLPRGDGLDRMGAHASPAVRAHDRLASTPTSPGTPRDA